MYVLSQSVRPPHDPAVCRYVLRHPQCLQQATHLMWWQLTLWTYRTGGRDGYVMKQEQIGCLLGVLAHCSHHIQRHMMSKRRLQQRRQHAPRVDLQPPEMVQVCSTVFLLMAMYSETLGITEGAWGSEAPVGIVSNGWLFSAPCQMLHIVATMQHNLRCD